MITETEPQFDALPPNSPLSERLAGAVVRLTTVLEREVGLLRGTDARPLAALVLEKREATKEYRDLLTEFGQQDAALAGLDGARRDELATLGHRLAAATEANVRALKAGIEANARLVRTISQAVG